MMPGMMPPGMGMNPFGMGMDPFGMEDDPMLEDEIKTINERLAKNEPLNQYNDTGDTELMIAARAGDLDLAKRLLEKKANANLKVNLEPGDFGAGETALHIAAIRENKTMCELLYNNGALLNVKDEKGFTPLDAILSNFDTGPDPFTGKMINPKMTRKGKATIAYLQSKGGKSMTAKQRAEVWKANDPFMDMMMPGGMPPNPFMMPPEGNPYASPKSRNSKPPKRR
ncbi:ankyrin repeat domain-containing protein [bacterium]|nr:ankyrin repeat domain-containing protein [bacterium]